jgi:hypothetical protein
MLRVRLMVQPTAGCMPSRVDGSRRSDLGLTGDKRRTGARGVMPLTVGRLRETGIS